MAVTTPFAAIVLTGGKSRRMGSDKAQALWDGVRAVDRVVALAQACGAARLITVGLQDYGLTHVSDPTPHGGPVGGLLAGARMLAEAGLTRLLILAVDAPTILARDLADILNQPSPGAAYEGLLLPMVLDLAFLPAEAEAAWPLARFVERAGLRLLPCPMDRLARLRGANTPEERDALILSLRRG